MGRVAVPEEDVAARARSIFERLRAEQQPEDIGAAKLSTLPPGPVLRWDLLPLVIIPTPVGSPAAASELLPPDSERLPPVLEAAVDADDGLAEAGVDALAANPAAQPVSPEPAPPPEAEVDLGAVTPDGSRLQVEEKAPEPEEPQPAGEEVPTSISPFLRPLPRVVAIANQKGGVGKTTTTVNLGASLAVLGYRVLVVDLDPQGNATTGLGINSRNLEHSIYDVLLHDVPVEDCVEPTSLRNLFVAPSTIDLAGAEIELVAAFSRELRLRRALQEALDDFDFVLIDCPPSLGLLTVNGLAAATEVLVPIQCEYYALEGLGQLLRNVNLVQGNLNPQLEVSAIVLTMYDARTKLAEQVAGEVRQHFGTKVCRNIVPRTVRLSEAPSFGQPIIVFDPSSRGSLAYRELAKEVSGGAPQRTG
ncbi:MAG: AAA family ATPase [Actinobacteria bacterium]|nr:AAA family ATPase [Actinomycetota bacterium]